WLPSASVADRGSLWSWKPFKYQSHQQRRDSMIESEIKARFCETDALGHVNNTSYFVYLEQARVEFFEELGAPMGMSEWPFILGHISCDFLRQVYFNQR